MHNDEFYELTQQQRGIWYTEKLYPETSIGVVAGTFRFKGNINYKTLEKAINIFVKTNDAMRTRITEHNGEAKQYFAEYEPFNVELLDFSDKETSTLYDWEKEQTMQPMELLETPLFKFTMIKISDTEGGYLIKTHHLISDAWSMTVIVNNVARIYFELIDNKYIEEQAPSYIEYIKNYEKYTKSDKFQKDHEYWINKYNVAPEVTALKPRTQKEQSVVSNRKTFVLPEKLCKKIYEYSKENNVSVFSMYMSAISMYIHRITGKENLNLGTIILNRANQKEKNTMGMFITTLPVVLNVTGNTNFNDLSHNVTVDMMGLMRHHKYPFELIQEELRHKYNFDDVLYDIILSYQNAKFLDKEEDIDFKTRWHFCGYQSNGLSIHINDRDHENKLIIDYDYITSLFYDKEIDFLHDHIIRLLWHSLDNPKKELNKLEMVSEVEKHKILYEFNNTTIDYPRNKVVHELIEETVKQQPDKVAIISNGESITYDELNKKANIVANKLRSLGIKPNDMVGLLINRSVNMMIGLLGIMKSGAAYLPIDPEYPEERIKYMLTNSKAKFLLTELQLTEQVNSFDIEKFFIEKDFENGCEENPDIINNPEDLIYVIYTSGSTGNPKGVMLKHKNINNLIKGTSNIINFNNNKTIVSVTTICFDIFVVESWLSLQKGLTIVLANEEEQNIPQLFNELCLKNNVNIMQTTPSRTDLLTSNESYIDYAKNITDFIVGGEPFPEILLNKLKNISNANIYNGYGPTETAVYSSMKDLTKENTINIGRPLANTEFYILDKTLNLCPIGMIGELYIGGEGLAKGYLGNEELTNDRFIKNPFKENDLIYKTGDLARWMSNGEVCHMGRSDFQVKIRGYRIELEDIEKNILQNETIKKAVVKVFNDKYIVAYLVPQSAINLHTLKKELQKRLPHYMLPCKYIILPQLYYTPNGKIDFKKLPEPELNIETKEVILPTNETEKILYNTIKNALDIESLSIDDNFLEIGADSLLFLKIQTELFMYDFGITTQHFYEYSSIKELAKFIDAKGTKHE